MESYGGVVERLRLFFRKKNNRCSGIRKKMYFCGLEYNVK